MLAAWPVVNAMSTGLSSSLYIPRLGGLLRRPALAPHAGTRAFSSVSRAPRSRYPNDHPHTLETPWRKTEIPDLLACNRCRPLAKSPRSESGIFPSSCHHHLSSSSPFAAPSGENNKHSPPKVSLKKSHRRGWLQFQTCLSLAGPPKLDPITSYRSRRVYNPFFTSS